jgi:prepilin-type processing-associated H-X9-DG protein
VDVDQPATERQPPLGELQPTSNWLTPVLKFLALFAIVGLVIALLLPTVRSSREAARRNSCFNNLKQIGLGLQNYADAHGHYPPAYTTDAAGNRLHSWRTLVLPFCESSPLYSSIDLTKPWDDPANAKAASTVIRFYQCPSVAFDDPESPLTTYLAIVTPESAIRAANSRTPEELEKVAANALLIIDAPKEKAVRWMSPEDADETALSEILDSDETQSQHSGNILLGLFADGHVAAIPKDIDPAALRAMTTVSSDDDQDVEE